MKKKTLTITFSFCFLLFGIYQGHQNYLEIQSFEKKYASADFSSVVSESHIPKNIQYLKNDQHDVYQGNTKEKIADVIEPQIVSDKDEVAVEEQPYQPTSKDPLLHLSEDLKSNPSFTELSDFSRDELDVVLKSKDRPELARVSAQVIKELQGCLNDGRCVEDVDPSSDYYRHGHTRSHQLLERTLHTLIIIQEEDESLRQTMNFDDKLAILDVDNSEIQRLGLELLGTQELNAEQVTKILSKDRSIDQEAQGALFTQVERYTRTQPELRRSYLEHLQKQFANDAAAAIEILKVLPFARLEENEIAQVSRGLCLHQNGGAPQNWQAIEYHHSLYQDSQGNSTRLSSLCSAQ